MTPQVPSYLMSCDKAPPVPDGTSRMPEINLFIIDLHSAHADCHKKLEVVGTILEGFEASIEGRAAEQAETTQ